MFEKRDMELEINKDKYKEVRESEEFKRLSFLTIGGSLAYGTNIETEDYVSDVDFRGFVRPSLKEVYAMDYKEKPYLWNGEDKDVTLYPLKQMIKLLCSCNPNIVEIMGTRDEQVLYCDEVGKLLKENINLFMTQRAYYTFGGMARDNLRLMKNLLYKRRLTAEDKAEFTVDSLAIVINNALDHYNSLRGQDFRVEVDRNVRSDDFLDYLMVNGELKGLTWLDLKGLVGEIGNVIRGYDSQKLTQHNDKKDKVHLYKNIMHTYRTYKMGVEILRGEGLKVYREKDKELMLEIRKGIYTIDELFEMVEKEEKELDYAKENTNLPEEVDRKKVEELTIELVKKSIKLEQEKEE